VEVDLCGHATLASAHSLYESGRVSPKEMIKFHVKNNVILTAIKNSNGSIELNFPATVPTPVSFSESEISNILQGFNIRFEDLIYTGKTIYDILLEITSDSFEKLIVTDFQALERLGGRGIIVTRKGNTQGYDFTSRFFGPW
jgi:predicted PhzF superfamily epimerase YddE/YHI9